MNTMNTMNTPREDEARREIETYLAILETKGWDVYTVTKDGTQPHTHAARWRRPHCFPRNEFY